MKIMKKKFRKIQWKQVLLYVLISALTLAAFAGIGSLFNRDTKTIRSSVKMGFRDYRMQLWLFSDLEALAPIVRKHWPAPV